MRNVLSSLLVCWALPLLAWQNYGPVQKNDSLISVAKAHSIAGVSLTDMVTAITLANPKALTGKHHDLLEAGSKLRLPTTHADIRALLSNNTPVSSKAATHPALTVVTTPKNANPVPSALAAAEITIQNLQAALTQQQQALSAAQAKLTQLQAAPPIPATTRLAMTWLSWSTIWFILLLITLLLMWRMKHRYNKLLAHTAPPVQDKARKEPIWQASQSSESSKSMASEDPIKGVVSNSDNNFQQVELDIPIPENPIAPVLHTEPPLNARQKSLLAGERDALMKAINDDESNPNWHMALLEFYLKTNNQNGFNRHYQTMIKNKRLIEGSEAWEVIRKLYLNKWIYGGL